MARVVWDGRTGYEMVLNGHCKAAPEVVYDVLADLTTHLDWGGRGQRRGFRLTSMRDDDPRGGPVQVGTEFSSEGTIPMTRTVSHDHSVVVAAQPAAVLEFHTDSFSVWPTGKRTESHWEHRYQIDPDGTGSQVTYRLRMGAVTGAPLRMRAPLMRTMSHKVMLPFFCQRGFNNLLRAAQKRAPVRADG